MNYIDTGYSCMPIVSDEVFRQKMMGLTPDRDWETNSFIFCFVKWHFMF